MRTNRLKSIVNPILNVRVVRLVETVVAKRDAKPVKLVLKHLRAKVFVVLSPTLWVRCVAHLPRAIPVVGDATNVVPKINPFIWPTVLVRIVMIPVCLPLVIRFPFKPAEIFAPTDKLLAPMNCACCRSVKKGNSWIKTVLVLIAKNPAVISHLLPNAPNVPNANYLTVIVLFPAPQAVF